jgi:hypothetical protein
VETHTNVNILAVVNERNGDLGTFAMCELYTGGTQADYAMGVWVDAGDAVTCAMTVAFTNPGTYPLQVRVRTAEREWDTGNNTDTATIQVNGAAPRFYAYGMFSQVSVADSSLRYEYWNDAVAGSGRESRSERFTVSRHQSASLYGFMPSPVVGPVSARMSMSSGGRIADPMEWSSPGREPEASSWCTSQTQGRTIFSMCSYGGQMNGGTQVSYALTAGSVTYHSMEYSRTWDGIYGEWVYHWNSDSAYDDTVPLGDDWTFNLLLSTTSGEYDLSRSMQLVPVTTVDQSSPYACTEWEDPWWGWSSKSCSQGSYRGVITWGFVTD